MNGVPVQPLTVENVEECFTFAQWDDEQIAAGKKVVATLIAAAKIVLEVVPPGPDRSTALRKLREARMDANSAITHRGKF